MDIYRWMLILGRPVSKDKLHLGMDYIYTYPGLRTGLVNTNQHLHSTLYLHIRISVTLPPINFEIAISGSESHHVVTEENWFNWNILAIYFIILFLFSQKVVWMIMQQLRTCWWRHLAKPLTIYTPVTEYYITKHVLDTLSMIQARKSAESLLDWCLNKVWVDKESR